MATKRRKAGKQKSGRVAGWIYMLMGLTIGLTVAAAIYVSDRQQPLETLVQPAAPVPAEVPDNEAEIIEEPASTAVTFDFYEMLPNLDVEVYEDETAPSQPPVAARPAPAAPTKPKTPAAPVQTPGIYILQAGSFTRLEDANRRKAQIALLGVRTEIKPGDANGRKVYRVYTDPIDNTAEVNRLSELLTRSDIEILRKRVK
jgi:cell division protein FtsN